VENSLCTLIIEILPCHDRSTVTAGLVQLKVVTRTR
jgi:hypothetical protein